MRFRFLPLLLLVACASSITPKSNSREEIVAYVNRAADLVRARGAACATLATPEWYSGDWYIFVFDGEGRTVCHPAKPEMVGTPAADLVDPNGKRFGDEFLRVASAGGGWVEYAWPRPGETASAAKSAYVRQVTSADGKTYVVGSGGYEPR